jgi:dihydrofolate synthase / folylpolyglutamate synthase
MTVDDGSWDEFVERLYRQNEFTIKLGLEAMEAALEREGRPERSHARLLVGGTNGKGETAAFLASILQEHGLRVGLYTSPHVIDLRERFRVDGTLLPRETMYRVGRQVLEGYGEPEGPGAQLTFFELTTLMAVLAFCEQQIDVGVYEVGLGGRLDATNALSADLSVVTCVALDHQEFLGDTLEAVAAEKAGIFRAGRPAIIGRQLHVQAEQELSRRAPEGASIYGRDYHATEEGGVVVQGLQEPLLWADALALTRAWNAACAAEAARRFLGEAFDHARLRRGLSASRWPGRLDRRVLAAPDASKSRASAYLFDAAHNPAGAKLLFDLVEQRSIDIGAVVFGAMSDKDLAGIVESVPRELAVFGAQIDSPRAAGADELTEALANHRLVATGPSADMLERARQHLESQPPSAHVLVFGSVYLLGECFQALGIDADSLVTHRR